MDKTIRRYSNLEEMKADEIRDWQQLSAAERMEAVAEMTLASYRIKGLITDVPRLERTLVRLQQPERPDVGVATQASETKRLPRSLRTRPANDSRGEGLLDFRHVSVMLGGKRVLDDVTLTIGAGEHVAILGPNGCGKSTLIKTVTRECYPLAEPGSSLTILGRETWNVFELRRLLGIVSSELLERSTRQITGREMVLSGFFSSIGVQPYHQVSRAMTRKTNQVLELLGARHLADREMNGISPGEAHRLLIGRALVHDPMALLLDEPSNSLDFRAALGLRDILRKLARTGTGILMVTHHLADILPEIDRVILLREGRVYADGPKRALLTTQRLSKLFGLPVHVAQRDGYYHLW